MNCDMSHADHDHYVSKAPTSRRQFLRGGIRSALLATAATYPLSVVAAKAAGGTPLAKPRYYGTFEELPIGAVQPRGWISS
jgi:hypothetical protein